MTDSAIKELTTTLDVMNALGGIQSVVAITGRTYNAVFNWKTFTKFPSNTFVVMNDALQARGLKAPASLWGMIEAGEPERAAS